MVLRGRSESGSPGDCLRAASDVLAGQLVVLPVIVVAGREQQGGQAKHQAPHPVLPAQPGQGKQ